MGLKEGMREAWNSFIAGFRAGRRAEADGDVRAAGAGDQETIVTHNQGEFGAGRAPDTAEAASQVAGQELRSFPAGLAADHYAPGANLIAFDEAGQAKTLELPEMEALRTQIEQMETERAHAETSRRAALLTDYKRAGLLAPAAESAASLLLERDEATFRAFLEANGRHLAFSRPDDQPRSAPPNGAEISTERQGSEDPGKLLERLTKARIESKGGKTPYHLAYAEVCRERPDLAADYLAFQR